MAEPIVIADADAVIVCADDGTPVAVGRDMSDKVFVSQAGEKNFSLMLESLGYRVDEIPQVVTTGD